MLSPGTYLKKRREAAGVNLASLAARLAGLPWAVRPVRRADVDRLVLRLRAAEADLDNLTISQADLLRNVYSFDLEIYERLLLIHYAGHGGVGGAWGLPEPQICRSCACTWHDACVTDHGPCAWSDHDPELCTACDRSAAATAELGPNVAQFAPRAEAQPTGASV